MAKHPYEDLAAEVVRIIDWESLGIPPRHKVLPTFRELAKRLHFDATRDLERLASAIDYLCVYGFLDRATTAALALGAISADTPMLLYMYISTPIALTCCLNERGGNQPAADQLRALALNAPGKPYRPMPKALDGSMLKNLWGRPADIDRNLYAGWAFGDIGRLANMWVFGSPSPEWTRERIGAAIDTNVANIRALEKWRPW